jgi:hypothetical protein
MVFITKQHKILLAATIGLIACHLPGTEGSPYIISDDRVRSLDVTPVLGRGYSIGTNSFQSTCLMVDGTTVPSYNYDYYFTDLTEQTDTESQMAGKVSGSFGYWGIKAELNAETKSSSKFSSKTHVVASTMRIERYYSSVQEEKSDLSSDAFELLDRKDYIGFFKACGPNYVRSIRRAQEVTAIFTFTSQNEVEAQEFAASLKVSGWGQSVSTSLQSGTSMQAISNSMTIKILGFGLGLNQEGSDTLVASSLKEYNKVMKFAFQSMTQDGGNGQTGMVYGIEVVPWVDNTAFQVASRMHSESIEVPMPRSLIPKAILVVPSSTTPAGAFATSDRDKYTCKDSGFQIDKYGYCCFPDYMYDPTASLAPPPTEAPVSPDLDRMICKPTRYLDPTIMKNNMANNGEFVALLDSTVRYKLNTMFTLEKCVTAVRSFPEKYSNYILKSQDTVKYDAAIEIDYTVAELKMAIDPKSDYSLVKHMAGELDEFMDMYYEPCLAALFGTNIGNDSDTDPKYFMAESWYNHDSCTKLSCLADNMRWDRSGGGSCVPSLITGVNAPDVTTAAIDNAQCTKIITDAGEEDCKYPAAGIVEYQRSVKTCWGANTSVSTSTSPIYLMEHFCMPQLSGDKANTTRSTAILTMVQTCASSPDPFDERFFEEGVSTRV